MKENQLEVSCDFSVCSLYRILYSPECLNLQLSNACLLQICSFPPVSSLHTLQDVALKICKHFDGVETAYLKIYLFMNQHELP